MYTLVAVPISYVFESYLSVVEVGVIPEIESLLYVSKSNDGSCSTRGKFVIDDASTGVL